MKYLVELSSLITVRNFLAISLDSMNIIIKPEQVKEISKKVSLLNEIILQKSLELDVNFTSLSDNFNTILEWKSTENTQNILENLLDKPSKVNKKTKRKENEATE